MTTNPENPGARGRKRGNGAGQGPGWGGPARGAHPGELTPFQPGNQAATFVRPDRAARKAERERRVQVLEDRLFDLAQNAEREETQVQAATRLHAIYEGAPVARNVNLNVSDVADLSDADIHAELARLRGTGTDPVAGTGAADGGEQDRGLPSVH